MNVGQLKELLDDYGDHLEVRLVDESREDLVGIDAVDTQTRDGELFVVIVAE